MPLIISPTTQTLVVPDSPGLSNMFPDAPVLDEGRLVEHTIPNTLMLRHLGFDVPNPMMYYDWHGGTPFAVQKATCRMLTENPCSYVLNHMGTGKTRTALWAWDYLHGQGLAGKALVVAPLSTLALVWQREAFTTLSGMHAAVLHGTKTQRLKALARDVDLYVINHDGLRTISDELLARKDIDTLILDELAVYRNDNSRSRHMRKFATNFNIVWGLTGTPMPNEPTDVWAQCKIVTPNSGPKYRTHARDMLMHRVSQYMWRPKPDAVNTAFSWMQPSCRFSLDEVVELPPVISRTVDAPLSELQEKTYKDVATTMVAEVKAKTITAINAGAELNKLMQIAGGWVYTNSPEFVGLDPVPRVLALADIIYSAHRKVIVAVPYRHAIEGISKIFSTKGVDIDHCVVHGDTKNRDELFGLFQQTDKYKVLLVDPGCVKHGLTLTAADTIIWYLPIFSLETYDQLNARITRYGQQHKQQIIHLQGTPVERRAYKSLYAKHKTQASFLELIENATEDLA